MSIAEKRFEPEAGCPLDGTRVIDMSRLDILVDLSDDAMGRLPMRNVIPRLSATPGQVRRPAPGLGEHTAEILGGLGLDRAELEVLAAEGIIGLAGATP